MSADTDRSICTELKYIALIPAYEPDEKLLSVIKELNSCGFETVVVDDGSGPDYKEIFREAGRCATVISYENNMGKGAALRTGLAYIYDYRCGLNTTVVTVDADGQHRAKDVIRVAGTAAKYPGTLVLGSRGIGCPDGPGNSTFAGGPVSGEDSAIAGAVKIPLRSRFGNTVTRHVFRLATGVPVSDTQTGLRAFTADLIPGLLEVRGMRYEYEINMLLDFAAAQIPVREERIDTVYIDNNSSSHFDTVKDSYRIYKEILKFSASSLIGFATDYSVFAVLTMLTSGVVLPNILARLVSSVTNFTINRNFVFGSKKKVTSSALRYFTLAAVILAGNTIVLDMLTGRFGINSLAAKIITELIFFVISWTVQRYIIFYNDETAEKPAPQSERYGYAEDEKAKRFIVKSRAVRTPRLRDAAARNRAGKNLPLYAANTGKEA